MLRKNFAFRVRKRHIGALERLKRAKCPNTNKHGVAVDPKAWRARIAREIDILTLRTNPQGAYY